jgi:phosphopantetheinyl transferase
MPTDFTELAGLSGALFFDPSENVKLAAVRIDRIAERYFGNQPLKGNSLEITAFDTPCREWGISLDKTFSNFRTFKRQIEWFSGRAAFTILDRKHLGGGHNLSNDAHGAPCVEKSDIPISVTHAGQFAAAGICISRNINLGIDIERVRSFEHRDSFFRVAFPEENPDELNAMGDDRLMELWTLKESFLKIIKKGFAENLREVKIGPDFFTYHGSPIKTIERASYHFENHVLSVLYGTLPETLRG